MRDLTKTGEVPRSSNSGNPSLPLGLKRQGQGKNPTRAMEKHGHCQDYKAWRRRQDIITPTPLTLSSRLLPIPNGWYGHSLKYRLKGEDKGDVVCRGQPQKDTEQDRKGRRKKSGRQNWG